MGQHAVQCVAAIRLLHRLININREVINEFRNIPSLGGLSHLAILIKHNIRPVVINKLLLLLCIDIFDRSSDRIKETVHKIILG
ncbi:hypothetical protein D3C77_579770 [compost metagenome]